MKAKGVNPQNISGTGVEQVYANGYVGKRLIIMKGEKVTSDINTSWFDDNTELTANNKGGMTRIIESKPEDLLPNELIFCSVDGFDTHLYGAKALKKLREARIMLF